MMRHSRWGHFVRSKVMGGVFIVAVIAFFGAAYAYKKQSYIESTKTMRFSYTLSNGSGGFIPYVNFSVAIPGEIKGVQHLRSISADVEYSLAEEDGGRRINFVVKNISPYSAKIINFVLEVVVNDKPRYERIDSANYLSAEKYIEVDAPVVKSLAAQLKGKGPEVTAKNIYNWLVSNVTSTSYTAASKGAHYLIKNKVGDCTELAYAFVALARANGIPARVVRGLWVNAESAVINSASYHDWAEFHDGERWFLVDPQKNILDESYNNYMTLFLGGYGGFRWNFTPHLNDFSVSI